jgi:uncharacterized repeat protein (TIGR03803 family)
MKGPRVLFGIAAAAAVTLIPSSASAGLAFTNLYSFLSQGTNAHSPKSALLQALDGSLYGTTAGGGGGGWISPEMANKGIVFKITRAGDFTTVVSFNGRNGANVVVSFTTADLIQGSDGNLYGTTSGGGSTGYGTVFKLTTNGILTTLHSFEGYLGTNGWGPGAGLVEGRDGCFYGTACRGGAKTRGENVGMGTVYRVNTNGLLKTLHYFTGTDGEFPAAPLLLAKDGCLYGTTPYGGLPYAKGPPEHGDGTLYRITTNGVFTSLFSFSGTNGARPYSGLVQASDGNFYGTTKVGGAGFGTLFKLTPGGVFTSLFSFTGTNGAWPMARLTQGSDGYLYGTTCTGGRDFVASRTNAPMYGNGTIFRISTNGNLTTLLDFEPSQGVNPSGALVQTKDGDFFGTAAYGGANGEGTIFRFSLLPGTYQDPTPSLVPAR